MQKKEKHNTDSEGDMKATSISVQPCGDTDKGDPLHFFFMLVQT